jgi:hypothetical protein
MPITRVFVMGLTSMLSDVVQAVVSIHPGLTLVGESPVIDFWLAAASMPDVVVAAQDDVSDADLAAFLGEHCRAWVLALAVDSGRATLYEMRPCRMPLGDVGTDELAGALLRRWGEP